jgi:hypothetical protein
MTMATPTLGKNELKRPTTNPSWATKKFEFGSNPSIMQMKAAIVALRQTLMNMSLESFKHELIYRGFKGVEVKEMAQTSSGFSQAVYIFSSGVSVKIAELKLNEDKVSNILITS